MDAAAIAHPERPLPLARRLAAAHASQGTCTLRPTLDQPALRLFAQANAGPAPAESWDALRPIPAPPPDRLAFHDPIPDSPDGLVLRSYPDGLLAAANDRGRTAIATLSARQAVALHAWLGATIAARKWS